MFTSSSLNDFKFYVQMLQNARILNIFIGIIQQKNYLKKRKYIFEIDMQIFKKKNTKKIAKKYINEKQSVCYPFFFFFC